MAHRQASGIDIALQDLDLSLLFPCARLCDGPFGTTSRALRRPIEVEFDAVDRFDPLHDLAPVLTTLHLQVNLLDINVHAGLLSDSGSSSSSELS